jgi:hypothetical protein
MSFKVKVSFTESAYKDLQKRMKKKPDEFKQMLNGIVDQTAPKLMAQLQYEPEEVKYPIIWTSLRQRQAFFATEGFGRGIPTYRTHKTARGWTMKRKFNKGSGYVFVENKTRYLKYVVLDRQQYFHELTRWRRADKDIHAFRMRLRREIEKRSKSMLKDK